MGIMSCAWGSEVWTEVFSFFADLTLFFADISIQSWPPLKFMTSHETLE